MAYALLVESLMRSNKPRRGREGAAGHPRASTPARSRRGSPSPICRAGAATPRRPLETLRGAPEEVRDDPRLRAPARLGALPDGGDLDGARAQASPAPPTRPASRARTSPAGLDLLRGLVLAAQGAQRRGHRRCSPRCRTPSPRTPGSPWRSPAGDAARRPARRGGAAARRPGGRPGEGRQGRRKPRRCASRAAQITSTARTGQRWRSCLRPAARRRGRAACRLQAAVDAGRRRCSGPALRRGARPARHARRTPRRWSPSGPRCCPRPAATTEADGAPRRARRRRDAQSALAAAQAYQRLERYQESIPVLEKLAAHHPDQALIGFLLGAAYERSGQRDKAVTEFRRVLKMDPDFHAALNYLGYMFAEAGDQPGRGPEAGEPGGGARPRQRRLRRLARLDLLSDSAVRSRPATISNGPPGSSPRTRRCRSTWGMSMLRWGRRRGHGRPTSGRSSSEANDRQDRDREGPAQAGRARQGGSQLLDPLERSPRPPPRSSACRSWPWGCAGAAPSLVRCRRGALPPWQIPQAAYGSQRLFRVSYSGPEGEGSFRVTLRLVSPARYQIQAVDPLGRALWSLDVMNDSGLWLDHRNHTFCTFEGRFDDLRGARSGPSRCCRSPALLLAGCPPSPPRARPRRSREGGCSISATRRTGTGTAISARMGRCSAGLSPRGAPPRSGGCGARTGRSSPTASGACRCAGARRCARTSTGAAACSTLPAATGRPSAATPTFRTRRPAEPPI